MVIARLKREDAEIVKCPEVRRILPDDVRERGDGRLNISGLGAFQGVLVKLFEWVHWKNVLIFNGLIGSGEREILHYRCRPLVTDSPFRAGAWSAITSA